MAARELETIAAEKSLAEEGVRVKANDSGYNGLGSESWVRRSSDP
jgi:hypothetical protein